MSEYLKHFATEPEAVSFAAMKNQAARRSNNYRDVYVVTDGPSNNFSVMDLRGAINLGIGYRW